MKIGPNIKGPKILSRIQRDNYVNNISTIYEEKWPELRIKVLRRDNFKCKKCLNSFPPPNHWNLHCDHIVPLSKGGKNLEYNLQTICMSCHNKKHPHMVKK